MDAMAHQLRVTTSPRIGVGDWLISVKKQDEKQDTATLINGDLMGINGDLMVA